MLARDERDDRSAGPGSARAPRAVHVCLFVLRGVEVDDAVDAFDVNAARGDIGTDENLKVLCAERLECLIALCL